MSTFGSPTEGLSELVDHFIQPFVNNIASYIRETQDFRDILLALCPIPVDSTICKIDLAAQYPSIPQEDGLANIRNALLENSTPSLTIISISDMNELYLNVMYLSSSLIISFRLAEQPLEVN